MVRAPTAAVEATQVARRYRLKENVASGQDQHVRRCRRSSPPPNPMAGRPGLDVSAWEVGSRSISLRPACEPVRWRSGKPQPPRSGPQMAAQRCADAQLHAENRKRPTRPAVGHRQVDPDPQPVDCGFRCSLDPDAAATRVNGHLESLVTVPTEPAPLTSRPSLEDSQRVRLQGTLHGRCQGPGDSGRTVGAPPIRSARCGGCPASPSHRLPRSPPRSRSRTRSRRARPHRLQTRAQMPPTRRRRRRRRPKTAARSVTDAPPMILPRAPKDRLNSGLESPQDPRAVTVRERPWSCRAIPTRPNGVAGHCAVG